MNKIVSGYHGVGNDFIIIDKTVKSNNLKKYIKAIYERRVGIGLDGIMFPEGSSKGEITAETFAKIMKGEFYHGI